eukprot:scaffold31785_cov72-Phaeocystis_antarctica.AAC.7
MQTTSTNQDDRGRKQQTNLPRVCARLLQEVREILYPIQGAVSLGRRRLHEPAQPLRVDAQRGVAAGRALCEVVVPKDLVVHLVHVAHVAPQLGLHGPRAALALAVPLRLVSAQHVVEEHGVRALRQEGQDHRDASARRDGHRGLRDRHGAEAAVQVGVHSLEVGDATLALLVHEQQLVLPRRRRRGHAMPREHPGAVEMQQRLLALVEQLRVERVEGAAHQQLVEAQQPLGSLGAQLRQRAGLRLRLRLRDRGWELELGLGLGLGSGSGLGLGPGLGSGQAHEARAGRRQRVAALRAQDGEGARILAELRHAHEQRERLVPGHMPQHLVSLGHWAGHDARSPRRRGVVVLVAHPLGERHEVRIGRVAQGLALAELPLHASPVVVKHGNALIVWAAEEEEVALVGRVVAHVLEDTRATDKARRVLQVAHAPPAREAPSARRNVAWKPDADRRAAAQHTELIGVRLARPGVAPH